MLTVFTKEIARGKFFKLIMLLFAVQFFLPVLLEPTCIFSSYLGDNDDNFHLHIAFHLESMLPTPRLPNKTKQNNIHDIIFCHLLHGNRKCKMYHYTHWSVRRRGAQSKHWERGKKGGWNKGRRAEGNSTCYHICLEEERPSPRSRVFFQLPHLYLCRNMYAGASAWS